LEDEKKSRRFDQCVNVGDGSDEGKRMEEEKGGWIRRSKLIFLPNPTIMGRRSRPQKRM
jgi:hypothetical protein